MGETPLYQAVDMIKIEHVKLLIQYKADPNIAQSDGLSSLHQAVIKQNVPIVECLLAKGANPNLKNKFFEMTPVHFAVKNDVNPTILLLLVQYNGSLVIKDINEKRPIDYVNSEEMKETLKKLRLQKEDIFRTPSKDRPVSFSTPSKLMTIANHLAHNNYSESIKKTFDLYGNTNTQDPGTALFHFIELNKKGIYQKKSKSDLKKNDINEIKCDLFQSRADRDNCSNRDIEESNNYANTNHYYITNDYQQSAKNNETNPKTLHSYYYTTEKKTKIYSPIKEIKEEEYYHDTDPSTKSIIIKTKKSMKNISKNLAVNDSIHLISQTSRLNDVNKENANTINIINLQPNFNERPTDQYLHSNNNNYNSNSTIIQFPCHQNNSFTILSPRLSSNRNRNTLYNKPNSNKALSKTNRQPSPQNTSHNNYSSNEITLSKQQITKQLDTMYCNNSNNEFDKDQERYSTIDSSKLYEWLCSIELQCYFPLFIDKGIYSIDQIIHDMKAEEIHLAYGDIEVLGIKKPGHIYRILIKMEIDAELINRKIAEYICPYNHSINKSTNIRISKEYLCCCGMSKEKITTKSAHNFDLISWLKNIHLKHLKENFEFNGFELVQYFVIQMFSSVPIDEDIITEALHIYNEQERDLIIMELNRNVRYVLKKVHFQMTSLEIGGEREETNCNLCSIF